MASWGIKVIDQLDNEQSLGSYPTENLEYGDAIAVGTEPPYNFWIWTRPDAVHDTAYWFDYGQISIVGPQGPPGADGPTGATGESTTWYTGEGAPILFYENRSMYLDVNSGMVYQQLDGDWIFITTIKGPQGAQGPRGIQGERGEQGPQGVQGPQGESGLPFHIEGVLNNSEQLPTPTQEIRAGAYLISDGSGNYDMYVIVGGHNEGDSLSWLNAGQVSGIETQLPENLVTTDTTQTITGIKTFDTGKLKTNRGLLNSVGRDIIWSIGFGVNIGNTLEGLTIYSNARPKYYDNGTSKDIALVEDIPAAPDLSNMVTTDTAQTITGEKVFSAKVTAPSYRLEGTTNQALYYSSSGGVVIGDKDELCRLRGSGTRPKYQRGGASVSDIALLSDIPTVPEMGDYIVTAFKTSNGWVRAWSSGFTEIGIYLNESFGGSGTALKKTIDLPYSFSDANYVVVATPVVGSSVAVPISKTTDSTASQLTISCSSQIPGASIYCYGY